MMCFRPSTIITFESLINVPCLQHRTLNMEPSSMSTCTQDSPQLLQHLNHAQNTLNSHLSTLLKCDKYIRIVTSLIKTHRAFNPQTKLKTVYKELVTVRRVIRWEGKYSTFQELREGGDSLGIKMFKVQQLMGDLVDQTSLWLSVFFKGTNRFSKLIEKLEQIECNCYFFDCMVNLMIHCYRLLKLSQKAKKEDLSTPQKSKLGQYKLKVLKYLLDSICSYNNTSIAKSIGPVNPKIVGIYTIVSSCISIYLLWR